MKKSSRLLPRSNTSRRSRIRQMYIKSARARRQARQEVFFIQEKAQENYGGFFGLLRFNEDYNKLRQSEQPEVTPAVDSNTLQDEIQDVMENSAETSEQFFEEMIARATENGTEE